MNIQQTNIVNYKQPYYRKHCFLSQPVLTLTLNTTHIIQIKNIKNNNLILQFKNMGASSQHKIEQTIQSKFKPIRKYYDDFYGQITIIQNKHTNQKYVKSQKVVHVQKNISEHIQQRLAKSYALLVNVKEFFRFPVDMCSGNEMCIFVMEYYQRTLYQEITERQNNNRPFRYEELMSLYYVMVQAVKLLAQIDSKSNTKKLTSNSSFIYINFKQIKCLESFFCSKNDTLQTDFPRISTHEQSQVREYYISPQGFSYLCRKQKFKAKQISNNQQSFIFTLGMNLLECALLADLSELYNKNQKIFEIHKLKQALVQVQQIYGENIKNLISKMTQIDPSLRPSLTEVEQYLKYLMRSNYIKLFDYSTNTTELNQ